MPYQDSISDEDYVLISQAFTSDYTNQLYGLILKSVHGYAQRVTEVQKLPEVFVVQDALIQEAVTNELFDLARLKTHHNVSNIHAYRLSSYMISWLIRRKPIQLIADIDITTFDGEQKDWILEINERACTHILMAMTFNLSVKTQSEDIQANSEQLRRMTDLIRALRFHMKYRIVNPHVLEMILRALITQINSPQWTDVPPQD